jgi:hypothetical protein
MEDTEPIHLTGEDAELATLLCDILDDLIRACPADPGSWMR